MAADFERFKDKGGRYEYLIDYWYYSVSFVAAGFLNSSLFGLADPYSTYYCSYSANYLAATEGI
jgi:hypothetical protein